LLPLGTENARGREPFRNDAGKAARMHHDEKFHCGDNKFVS
jgi:hypothetical protein